MAEKDKDKPAEKDVKAPTVVKSDPDADLKADAETFGKTVNRLLSFSEGRLIVERVKREISKQINSPGMFDWNHCNPGYIRLAIVRAVDVMLPDEYQRLDYAIMQGKQSQKYRRATWSEVIPVLERAAESGMETAINVLPLVRWMNFAGFILSTWQSDGGYYMAIDIHALKFQ